MAKRRRYRFKDFRIDEISAVDRPAQEYARAVLMKRAGAEPLVPPPQGVEKRSRLTSSDAGHSHLIWDDTVEGGVTSWGKVDSSEYGHEHPFQRNDDGSLTIGESDGHTHSIVPTEKPIIVENRATPTEKKSEENSMDPKQIEKLQSDFAAEQAKGATLQKQLDEANGKLSEFAKRAPDQVEYTADDGTVFYKCDDARMVKQAKRADAADRDAVQTRLEKRAEDEIPNLAIETADGVLLLGAVEKVADPEARKRIVAALKGASATIGKTVAKRTGDNGEKDVDGPKTAVAEFDEAVKKHSKEKGISYQKATIEVSNLQPALYKRVSQERAAERRSAQGN